MSFPRYVPIDDSFLFITKPRDLFFMSLSNERFIVVSNGRGGTRDIICVERSHNKYNYFTKYNPHP